VKRQVIEGSSRSRRYPRLHEVIYAIGDAYGTDTLERIDLFQNLIIKIRADSSKAFYKSPRFHEISRQLVEAFLKVDEGLDSAKLYVRRDLGLSREHICLKVRPACLSGEWGGLSSAFGYRGKGRGKIFEFFLPRFCLENLENFEVENLIFFLENFDFFSRSWQGKGSRAFKAKQTRSKLLS